mmetsp:Transcript_41464/g.132445  ORF Transcript_41464/g.132445 Transcript_41464/m.132445 type:complete len:282 (+) Transcript_41464:390-1235(+)
MSSHGQLRQRKPQPTNPGVSGWQGGYDIDGKPVNPMRDTFYDKDFPGCIIFTWLRSVVTAVIAVFVCFTYSPAGHLGDPFHISWAENLLLEQFGIGHIPEEHDHPVREYLFGVLILLMLARELNWVWAHHPGKLDVSRGAAEGIVIGALQVLFGLVSQYTLGPLGFTCYLGAGLCVGGVAVVFKAQSDRRSYHEQPGNFRRLYTSGAWGLSQHVCHFADAVAWAGLALVCGRLALLLVPIGMLMYTWLVVVPISEKSLRARYGEEYISWAEGTKKLIPFAI